MSTNWHCLGSCAEWDQKGRVSEASLHPSDCHYLAGPRTSGTGGAAERQAFGQRWGIAAPCLVRIVGPESQRGSDQTDHLQMAFVRVFDG